MDWKKLIDWLNSQREDGFTPPQHDAHDIDDAVDFVDDGTRRYVVSVIYVDRSGRSWVHEFYTDDREQVQAMKGSSEQLGHYVEVEDRAINPFAG